MKVRVFACLLFLAIAAPALAAAPHPDPYGLHALFESAWERELVENPIAASEYGDPRYNGVWPDRSLAALEKSYRLDQKVLEDLARIPRSALSPQDQLNHELFQREYRGRVAVYPFSPHAFAISQLGGIQTLNETAEILALDSVHDYEDWINRLDRVGLYVDQTIALLTLAIKEKLTQPRVIMDRIAPQIAAQIVEQPDRSPFYAPFKRFPEGINSTDRLRLTIEGQRAISQIVVPAYRRLQNFFQTKYLPACRKTVGIWDTPKGALYYANRIAHFTTTNLTAEEIHQIGLKEAARIRGEMDKVMARTGYGGSFADFLNFLRTDPRFYYKTGDELLNAYASTAKKIDPELVKLFGKLPRTPYGVRAIPALSAPNTYTAYYQPPAMDGSRAGYFYGNTYKPEARPKYEVEVLVTHEAVPGHHLQIALAQELGEMPMFRRAAGYTAYVEGWALYAESLGDELGLYTDAYSKFGQLTYEMWRAARLVVDTGIHHKRWTREQAIQYMKNNTAKSEADITNEVDRYISWPGQALAYKIGELKIQALRTDAKRQLGKRFNIKEFHDVILGSGAVPLDVLERMVDNWIDGKLHDGAF